MSNPTPPSNGSRGVVERAISMATQLTVQNLLIFALLVVLAVPSYFAWLFMTDTAFRHEFMSTSRLVTDLQVPCLVTVGNISGLGDRYTVAVSYGNRGVIEMIVAARMSGTASAGEVRTACEMAHVDANLLKAAIIERDAGATGGK